MVSHSLTSRFRGWSSGPFTPRAAVAAAKAISDIVSNLSFGSGVVVIGSHTGSPDPRQHPFRSGHRPYPASYAGTTGGGAGHSCPGFPAAFRPPAFACRVIRFPLRSWAFLTVGLPATNLAPDPNGLPRSARTRYDRDGCPLDPGDGGVLPAG
jgi:hypothetical protein